MWKIELLKERNVDWCDVYEWIVMKDKRLVWWLISEIDNDNESNINWGDRVIILKDW